MKGRRMKRDPRSRPVCMLCLEWVEVQHTIDGGYVILNKEGDPHCCKPYVMLVEDRDGKTQS